MRVPIPGRDDLLIDNLVLDVNGTIALDGRLLDGVGDRIGRLRGVLRVMIVTADTHGGADRLAEDLGVEVVLLGAGDGAPQKLECLLDLGADRSVTVGNGSNDVLMLERSALGICVVGKEGAAIEAVLKADIVVNDVCDALDLFLNPRRITATLRK